MLDRFLQGRLAVGFYRLAARLSGQILGRGGGLRSVLVHRSVATGEVFWGRSDIDLIAVLEPESGTGAELARLYRRLSWLRRFNPALSHVEVFRPSDLEAFARRDTLWSAQERASMALLYGLPVQLTPRPLDPLHALRRYLLWCEVWVTRMWHSGTPRNLRKIALECWNYSACALGLLEQPWLLRSQMLEHLDRTRPGGDWQRVLGQRYQALRFVLELAERLHQVYRSPLQPLSQTCVFEAVLPPFFIPRTLVVIPQPDSPLPAEAGRPNALVVTPQLLDLYLHYKNSFAHWTLPNKLALEPPTPADFRRDLAHYSAPHFLYFPGFCDRRAPHPSVRLTCLEQALTQLQAGRLPEALGTPPWHAPVLEAEPYYRHEFDLLAQRNQRLEAALGEPG